MRISVRELRVLVCEASGMRRVISTKGPRKGQTGVVMSSQGATLVVLWDDGGSGSIDKTWVRSLV